MSDAEFEPAFPRDHRYDGHNGMTLRDYFAAKAMQAILSNPDYTDEDIKLATQSYNIADAMMEARKK